MRCPNDDADLITQTKRRDNLTITYAQCPRCRGYWLDPFNASYIKTDDIASKGVAFKGSPAPPTILPVCPVCQEPLKPYHGENIPATVRVWRCPNGDGYFFPQAQLFAFKKAQEAKLTYYKLWNIPMPSVASVLLASIVGVVTLGLITTYLQYQSRQTTLIQARDIVRFQQAFIAGSSATVALTTTVKTDATIHIGDFSQAMQTTDRLVHTVFLSNLRPGRYQYYFSFISGGNVYRSEDYSFIIQ